MIPKENSDSNQQYLQHYLFIEDLIFECTPENHHLASSEIFSNFERMILIVSFT
jgi:hypothetical protein